MSNATITELEARVLTAIMNSEYHDGADPVENEVWTFSALGGLSPEQRGGVCASLQKKGLAEFFMGATRDDDVCLITRAGAGAIRAR